MAEPTAGTLRLRAELTQHGSRLADVLKRYDATNPRLLGSVAPWRRSRGQRSGLLVDSAPGASNELLRVAGLGEELSELLGVRVGVVATTLLRDEVSATALGDAVAV